MTREQIEHAIKCCNPYGENCGDCPFHDFPLGRCFEVLAKTAFNMLLDDRERLQKQVDEYKAKIEQGTLIELPCKVGDKFWCINETKYGLPFVSDMTVEYFKIINGVVYMGNFNCFRIKAWQKSELFLTREEAEKRLKELQR